MANWGRLLLRLIDILEGAAVLYCQLTGRELRPDCSSGVHHTLESRLNFIPLSSFKPTVWIHPQLIDREHSKCVAD